MKTPVKPDARFTAKSAIMPPNDDLNADKSGKCDLSITCATKRGISIDTESIIYIHGKITSGHSPFLCF